MSRFGELPFTRCWLASGEAVRAARNAIDPPDWPLNAVATTTIALDEEALDLLGEDAIDGRGLAINALLEAAELPGGDDAYVQIVETAVRDFAPSLALFADLCRRERPVLASGAMLRLGLAGYDLEEPAATHSPAGRWIRADRLSDLMTLEGGFDARIAALRTSAGDRCVQDPLLLGAWCASGDEPTRDSILRAKAAAALLQADRLRYEKRRTQKTNRVLRERNERLKSELAGTPKRGLLSRLFGR